MKRQKSIRFLFNKRKGFTYEAVCLLLVLRHGALRVLVHRHRSELGPAVRRVNDSGRHRRLLSASDVRVLRQAIRVRVSD
jgi:hypothetical protein